MDDMTARLTNGSSRFYFLKRKLVSVIEQQQTQGLEQGYLKLLLLPLYTQQL